MQQRKFERWLSAAVQWIHSSRAQSLMLSVLFSFFVKLGIKYEHIHFAASLFSVCSCFISNLLSHVLSAQVRRPEAEEIPLTVSVGGPQEDYVQPEGPLEARTKLLARAHSPQK